MYVREERLELPEEALREALLNAIAHRDYFNRPQMKQIGEKYGEGSEKSPEKTLTLIKGNQYITAKEMSRIIGISPRAVEKHITRLKKKGLIKRIGPDKGGHWRVVEDDK